MAQIANKGTAAGYTPLEDPEYTDKYSYNDLQKAGRIVREIAHKFAYGVSIMAQQSIKVNKLQEELVEMGFPAVELMTPDFTNPELLPEYAQLSAYQNQQNKKKD